jgi:hypothetical protein
LPVNQRVRELMANLGYTKNVDGFYKTYFGSGRSEKLRTVFNDENLIKTDFLVDIINRIAEKSGRQPNGHWVLTGQGTMYLTEKPTPATKNADADREREELYKDLAAFREIAKNLSLEVQGFRQTKSIEQG